MTAMERFLDAAFWMRHARSRYRQERKAKTHHDLSFRQWARRTYNVTACAGKLAALVQR
jgi:hypothetical protein